MITYIEYGDIFKLENVKNYAHGCNCAGAMGKGIALQFKKKFPSMYLEYKKICLEKKFNLGDVFVFKYEKGFVFNLGTQINWKTKAELNAIDISLKKMLEIASQKNINKIAMPKIGAGLGGLNWFEVKSIIEKNSELYPEIELVIVENFGNGGMFQT